jgi:2-polyprenyl-6-hydroxyphenyl methylase / 3-demethylubiquinone-9 3-methyltransferase
MARNHIPEGSLRGKTVLEAGCGFGQFALWLAEQGGDVTAGDLSGEACRIARDICGDRVDIDQFDVQNLVEPLGRDRFDLVCCLETLEHVPDHDLALRELVAVTKPGGRIIVRRPARWARPRMASNESSGLRPGSLELTAAARAAACLAREPVGDDADVTASTPWPHAS